LVGVFEGGKAVLVGLGVGVRVKVEVGVGARVGVEVGVGEGRSVAVEEGSGLAVVVEVKERVGMGDAKDACGVAEGGRPLAGAEELADCLPGRTAAARKSIKMNTARAANASRGVRVGFEGAVWIRALDPRFSAKTGNGEIFCPAARC
jgi:hypothetical protein